MNDTGKKFTQEGGAKVVSIGVGANFGFDREAFVEALFNGGPEDKVVSPLKESAEAEKSPTKLFMNMIEKGLDMGVQKEISAGMSEHAVVKTAEIVNMDRSVNAVEIQMHKSASRSA